MFRCFVDYFGYCNKQKMWSAGSLKGQDSTETYVAGNTCPEDPKHCNAYLSQSQRYPTLATGKK